MPFLIATYKVGELYTDMYVYKAALLLEIGVIINYLLPSTVVVTTTLSVWLNKTEIN